jgi:hypothetical protein
MKKSLITLLTIAAITGNAQNWLTTLNSGATTLPKFGLNTNHSLSFFTNNVERMKLTNTGRLGIGQANPAYALDVTGEIRASTNMRVAQNIFFGSTGQFKMSYTAPSAGNPGVFSSTGATVLNLPPDLLCGFNSMTIKAELFNTGGADYQFKGALDLISTTTGPRLQMVATDNGTSIFSRNSALFINKCGENVNVCSDGNGNMGVGAVADVNTRLYVTGLNTGLNVSTTHAADNMYNTKLTVDRNYAKALTVINTAGNAAGNENFTVYGDGSTNITWNSGNPSFAPQAGAVLNVYDVVGLQAVKLFNVGSPTQPNAFHINYDGVTTVNAKTSATYALRVKNNNNDLFAVNTSGVAYAREVIVTLNNFPDYVFANNYKLMPLKEVKRFIEKNHYLPNMPSAKVVEKDGANLGEIQRVTVEKLEEAYLYIFQLEEKLELMNKKLELLEQKKN